MADLTTTDAVRRYLELQGSQSADDDALFTGYIGWVNEWFDGQTNRRLRSAAYTEAQFYRGDGLTILPEQRPVTAVTTVEIDDVVVPTSTGVAVAGWFLDGDVIRLRCGYFVRENQIVDIAYTGGYVTVPADLSQAATEMVALRFRERPSLGQASMSVSGYSVTYLPSMTPATVKEVINRYRRIAC